MSTDNFCFYLQNRLIQTSRTGGQWYSDTSLVSIPCPDTRRAPRVDVVVVLVAAVVVIAEQAGTSAI